MGNVFLKHESNKNIAFSIFILERKAYSSKNEYFASK